MDEPVVTKPGVLSMQVCIPESWNDENIKSFADNNNHCGTTMGWCIRKQGNKLLDGANERVPCSERKGFIHVMLDA